MKRQILPVGFSMTVGVQSLLKKIPRELRESFHGMLGRIFTSVLKIPTKAQGNNEMLFALASDLRKLL